MGSPMASTRAWIFVVKPPRERPMQRDRVSFFYRSRHADEPGSTTSRSSGYRRHKPLIHWPKDDPTHPHGATGRSEAKDYLEVLERTSKRIDGFESPLGMELLATVDWLLCREGREPNLQDVKAGLNEWTGNRRAAERKLRLFDDRLIEIALRRLEKPL